MAALYSRRNTINARSKFRKVRSGTLHKRKTFKRGGGVVLAIKKVINDIYESAKSTVTKSKVGNTPTKFKTGSKKLNSAAKNLENINDAGKTLAETVDSIETDITDRKNNVKIDNVSSAILDGNKNDVIKAFDLLTDEIIRRSNIKNKKNNEIFNAFKSDAKTLAKMKKILKNEHDVTEDLKEDYSKRRKDLVEMMDKIEVKESVKTGASSHNVKSIMSIFGGIQSMLLVTASVTYLADMVYKKASVSEYDKLHNDIMGLKNTIMESHGTLNNMIYDSKVSFDEHIKVVREALYRILTFTKPKYDNGWSEFEMLSVVLSFSAISAMVFYVIGKEGNRREVVYDYGIIGEAIDVNEHDFLTDLGEWNI